MVKPLVVDGCDLNILVETLSQDICSALGVPQFVLNRFDMSHRAMFAIMAWEIASLGLQLTDEGLYGNDSVGELGDVIVNLGRVMFVSGWL